MRVEMSLEQMRCYRSSTQVRFYIVLMHCEFQLCFTHITAVTSALFCANTRTSQSRVRDWYYSIGTWTDCAWSSSSVRCSIAAFDFKVAVCPSVETVLIKDFRKRLRPNTVAVHYVQHSWCSERHINKRGSQSEEKQNHTFANARRVSTHINTQSKCFRHIHRSKQCNGESFKKQVRYWEGHVGEVLILSHRSTIHAQSTWDSFQLFPSAS